MELKTKRKIAGTAVGVGVSTLLGIFVYYVVTLGIQAMILPIGLFAGALVFGGAMYLDFNRIKK